MDNGDYHNIPGEANIEFVRAELCATQIAKRCCAAYWTHQTFDGYHAAGAIEELHKLAGFLGFDLVKRSKPAVETLTEAA